MKGPYRVLLSLAAWSGIALLPAAQGHVWVVDDTPGTGVDFATIQAAIDSPNVVDGDVLLVKPGTYASFRNGSWLINGKSLTIQADKGGVVNVGAASIQGIPSGHSVRLRGLSIRGGPAVTLLGCAGTIWIEDCTVTANWYPDEVLEFVAAMYVSSCSDVILIRNSIQGGNAPSCGEFYYDLRGSSGLGVSGGSKVHSYGCLFQGGEGGTDVGVIPFRCLGKDGGAGVRSMTSQDRLFFSDCVLRGGMGSISTDDFDQIGCLFPRGGPGLDTAGSAFVLDSTLSGGPGHPSFGAFCSGCNCNTGIDGPAFLGTPTFLPGKAQRATTSPAIREGGSLSIRVEGPPHVPVWFAASLAPRSTRHIGDLRGFVLLDLSSSPPLFFMGVTDAAGVLEKTVPFADLPAGIESSTTFFQFMYMESPMLPGGFKILRQPREEKVLVLGQGSMIVGLDEAF